MTLSCHCVVSVDMGLIVFDDVVVDPVDWLSINIGHVSARSSRSNFDWGRFRSHKNPLEIGMMAVYIGSGRSRLV